MLLLGAPLSAPASGGQTVDVWVELDDEPMPAPGAAVSAAAARRDRVQAQQDAIAARLASLGAVELARVQHVGNAIAVRVDVDRLAELRALPGVKRVRPARTLHPPKPMP